ncbi:hypothetical protein [Aquipuribacter sp. SD81]|uniref:hypothetical protein n=1 Tax=Aquipuribacter sp. SD81 TaxID=3127703 RepID=UPI0030173E7D
MRLVVLAVLGLVPLAAVGLLVCVLVLATRARRVPAAAVRRLDGRRAWLRPIGAALGVAAGAAVAAWDPLGRGVLLAPAVVATGVLVGVLVAELVVAPPRGPRRSAGLATRRVRDVLPRRLSVAVGVAAVGLLVLCSATALAASPDDLGRAGRALRGVCTDGSVTTTTPWPGSWYVVPLLLLVGLGLVLALAVLTAVVRRPPLASPDGSTYADAHVDAELRAQSARTVTAAVGLLVGVPYLGVALVAATTVHPCVPSPGLVLLLLLAPLPLVTALVVWCTALLLTGRHAPAHHATTAGRATVAAPPVAGSRA